MGDESSHNKRAPRVSPARLAAYEALSAIEQRDAFAQDIIAKVIDRSQLSVQDKAFATRLVLGVVSCKGSLDLILDRCLKNPKDVKANVRCALRISTYEIIYLDKQTHAAVDQGVELVGHVAGKARGLANFVLRKVASVKPSFPFGDPASNIDALALKEGFPAWLVAYLISVFGAEAAREFMQAANEPAPIYIALNFVKVSKDGFLAAADKQGVSLSPVLIKGHEVPGCFELENRKDAASSFILDAIKQGVICISDAAAQKVADIVVRSAVTSFASGHGSEDARATSLSESPEIDSVASAKRIAKEMRVLELCAGRATKTILLQSGFYRLLGSQVEQFCALDNVDFKVKLLKNRVLDYGIHIKDAICGDALDLMTCFNADTFDCVFLDSPCTGLGTLRRHPEIRWRCTQDSITDASKLDAKLLESAASVVSPGGILVYATCTITPEENEQAILSFLKTKAGQAFKIVPVKDFVDGSEVSKQKQCDQGSDNRGAIDQLFFKTFTTPSKPDSHFCCILKRIS